MSVDPAARLPFGTVRAARLCAAVSIAILLPTTAHPGPLSAQDGRASVQPKGLTAHRPQQGAGYFPFARTSVPEGQEDDPVLGPGIRRNTPRELDPSGEDDLIEVVVGRVLRGTPLVLARSGPELAVWTTRTKQPGTQLPFTGTRSQPLSFGGDPSLSLWVEWVGTGHGTSRLALETQGSGALLDRLTFHSFRSIVVALGGEGQSPGLPLDPNHGTFVVGTELYELGYDVRMYDEDGVTSNGSGPVYDEVVNAVQSRGVADIALFGYSHGGGSTHDLAERLDAFRAGIGAFAIPFTSYVDGVENDSDIDTDPELRYPPSSGFHANQYQRGTFADFFLDGGPVPGSAPPPTGLDVETTTWGTGATHFIVDDYLQVRDFILMNLDLRTSR
jgi:hypothetical protein